jgi:hypothetical protein
MPTLLEDAFGTLSPRKKLPSHRTAKEHVHPAFMRKSSMTDSAAKPTTTRTTGLSPKEQKLQALLAKTAHKNSGAKPAPGASAQSFSAKTSFAGKKTSFQRKAV